MRIKTFILLLLSLIGLQVNAQEVIFEEEVKENRYSNFGQNMQHFLHPFVDVAFIASFENAVNAEFLIGSSGKLGAGLRYKYKLINWLAAGTDVEVSSYNVYFAIPQNEENTQNIPYNNEKQCTFQSVELNPYIRFNFGKRGNIIGKFIDIGAINSFNINNRLIEKFKTSGTDQVVNRMKIETPKSAIDKFALSPFIRFGMNRNSLFIAYRITNLQLADVVAQVPEFTFGLQMGFIR